MCASTAPTDDFVRIFARCSDINRVQISNSVELHFYLKTILSMLIRRGRFITLLSRGFLCHRSTYAHVSLYVLQVVDTAIAQDSVSLEKGLLRERKSSKGEGAARDREPVLDSAYECAVNAASSRL